MTILTQNRYEPTATLAFCTAACLQRYPAVLGRAPRSRLEDTDKCAWCSTCGWQVYTGGQCFACPCPAWRWDHTVACLTWSTTFANAYGGIPDDAWTEAAEQAAARVDVDGAELARLMLAHPESWQRDRPPTE